METQTLLSLREAAARLKVPLGWLKQEAEAGRVPCLRAGRRLVFNSDAVHATLIERTKGRTAIITTKQNGEPSTIEIVEAKP